MPVDLPPNLQNTVNAIVRGAENTNVKLPANPTSQAEKTARDAGRDIAANKGRESSGTSEKRPK
jgi:hypothetical protein